MGALWLVKHIVGHFYLLLSFKMQSLFQKAKSIYGFERLIKSWFMM